MKDLMSIIKVGDKPVQVLRKIPEIRNIPKIDTFEDAIKLSGFVFSLISHSDNVESIDINESLLGLYHKFKKKENFGWCYTHALFLHLLLMEYNRESCIYNYGLNEYELSHAVTLLTIKGKRYLLDPYFNRYYVDEKGKYLTFEQLLNNIKKSKKIKTVYGDEKKEVEQQEDKFEEWSPQRLVDSVIDSWKKNKDMNKIMKKKFNSIDPLMLLTVEIERVIVLKKASGAKYFEFYKEAE